MAKFQFPGVYTNEVPVIQPIQRTKVLPVFIGYTEKNISEDQENTTPIAIKIRNLSEFEFYFGKAQLEKNLCIHDEIKDGENEIFVSFKGSKSMHNLYYSVRLYFENGGGSCSIISVGTYKEIGETLSTTELLSGLQALQSLNESFMVSVPESQNLPSADFLHFQRELMKFCNSHNGFALLDAPKPTTDNWLSELHNYQTFEENYSTFANAGAAFYPNLITEYQLVYRNINVKVKIDNHEFSLKTIHKNYPLLYQLYENVLLNFHVTLPPSPAVLAKYSRNQNLYGIWKASKIDALQKIIHPEISINNIHQEAINVTNKKFINVIRNISGRGILINGSKKMCFEMCEIKYNDLQLLRNLIAKDISRTLKMHENSTNNAHLWTNIKSLISNYLNQLWRDGALIGSIAEHAYVIRCNLNETMTAADVSSGKLIVLIGVAMMTQMEFQMIKFVQLFNGQNI